MREGNGRSEVSLCKVNHTTLAHTSIRPCIEHVKEDRPTLEVIIQSTASQASSLLTFVWT